VEREVNCGSTEAGAGASELTKGCWVGEGEGVSEAQTVNCLFLLSYKLCARLQLLFSSRSGLGGVGIPV